MKLAMAMRLGALVTRGSAALNIIQSDPLFYDPADSSNTTMSGRSGWTAAGDVTKRDKMKSANDTFCMVTGTNGDSPWGYQIAAASVGQYRRVKFGYDYSQQGGTLSNPATPKQYHDQRWILAYQDTANYLFASAFFSSGVMQMRIYRCVANVDTEICRYLALPSAATAIFELTDRIRLYIDGTIRVAEQLYTDAQAAFPDKLFSASTTNAMRQGATGLRHTFYPLILALDWKVEDLDMTVADPKGFYGRDDNNQRAIAFSGTYSGTPVTWAYRLLRKTTGAVAKNWTAFTPTANAGAWSATITVNSGGPYVMEVGWTDGTGKTHLTTSSPFAVGILAVMWGQSLAVGGSGVGGAPAPSGNDLTHGFNGYATHVGSSFRRWVDDTLPSAFATQVVPNMIGAAKRLSEALLAAGDYTPVGVAAVGVASQALTDLKPGSTYWNTVFVPFLAEIGGNAEILDIEQGQAEALSSSNYSNWSTDFDSCVAEFRAICGRSNAWVFLRITGKDTSVANNSTTTTRSQAMRVIQNGKHNPAGRVAVSCFDIGVPLSDTIHPTAAGHYSLAERDGLSYARHAFSAIAYDGRGPMLSTATRSGAVITLPITANGATSFTGSALTGYAVSNDDFATTLTINSTEIVGGELKITLSSTPTGVCKVDSMRGPNYADSSLGLGVYANGMTIPFFPIINPITVT